jgi:hypothetical protein
LGAYQREAYGAHAGMRSLGAADEVCIRLERGEIRRLWSARFVVPPLPPSLIRCTANIVVAAHVRER